jgi:small-conductance mechanosensitive channel
VFYYREDDRRESYEARYVVTAILMLAIGLALLLAAALGYALLIQPHRHV